MERQTQLSLFPVRPGRLADRLNPTRPPVMRTPHNDSATSRDAAEAIRPVASSMVRRVFEFLVSRGSVGATD